jgi:chemotaxis protein methyltransferase CheR
MALWESGAPERNLLDDELFRLYCKLVHDELGLSFGPTSRFFFEKRLENRLEALGGLSPVDYYHYLQFDPDRAQEWDHLISLITTNETYFMREERQLQCFVKDIVPRLRESRPGQRIRIWSAGCSSGEEPYTVAILLTESGLWTEGGFEILGTDVNTRVLARAKEGVFPESSFRSVDASFKNRWFQPESPGRYRLREEARRKVQFSRFNLFEADRYALLMPFDVILCRNVIIYFDMDAKVRVMERFHEKLRTGGFLLLGHSESLISVTDKFRLVHLPTDLVYTKEAP